MALYLGSSEKLKFNLVKEILKPVTYNYGGVELSDINTIWTNKETYPYAVLDAILYTSEEIESIRNEGYDVEDGAGIFYLWVYNEALVYDGTTLKPLDSTESCCSPITNSQGIHDMYEDMGYGALFPTTWMGLIENTDASDRTVENPIWTSHDIKNSDGTVYLAASDPVPVSYETVLSSVKADNSRLLYTKKLFPIEWIYGQVNNSPTVDLDGIIAQKISDVTLSCDEWQIISAYIMATFGTEEEIIPLSYLVSQDMGDDNNICIFSNGVYLYCASLNAGVYDSTIISETGLYCALLDSSFNPMEIEDGVEFKIILEKTQEQYIPSGGIVVASDSITEDSVTHMIYEDFEIPVVKIWDTIMTTDDIRASSMVSTNKDGTKTVYHTIGDYVDANSGSIISPTVTKTSGANYFCNVYSELISVYDATAAGERFNNGYLENPEPFPETGIYVPVPDEGETVEVILKFVDRYYNGMLFPCVENLLLSGYSDYKYNVIGNVNGVDCAYLLTEPVAWGVDDKHGVSCLITSTPCEYREYFYDTSNNEWYVNASGSRDASVSISTIAVENIIWSNHNILNVDGSVYFTASQPTTSI